MEKEKLINKIFKKINKKIIKNIVITNILGNQISFRLKGFSGVYNIPSKGGEVMNNKYIERKEFNDFVTRQEKFNDEQRTFNKAIMEMMNNFQEFMKEQVKTNKRLLNAIELNSSLLDKHGKILEKHGKILEKHGKILEKHGKILEEHTDILNELKNRKH